MASGQRGDVNSERNQFIERVITTAGVDDPEQFAILVRRFLRHVADVDLLSREPVDIAGLVLSHRDLAAVREADRPKVRVFTPTVDSHGWQAGGTVVQIVVQDMPFLVDSVTARLNALDRNIRLVVHPLLVVRRDANGGLLEVLDISPDDEEITAGGDDTTVAVESWMSFEVDREPDSADLEALTSSVTSVLSDIAAAVTDWRAMVSRAQEIAGSLVADVPADLAEQGQEARRLLEWMSDDHFTFLGYRQYALEGTGEAMVLRAVDGSGLGILRMSAPQSSADGTSKESDGTARESDGTGSTSFGRLPAAAQHKALERRVLILTKANSRSTVHRPVYLDYVGIKTFNDAGEVTGEHRFLGLLTAAAYTQSVEAVPIADRVVESVLERAGLTPRSHSGKDLLAILENYPRDELLQTDADTLYGIAMDVLHMQERRLTRLFVRHDDYQRFVSILVFLPRDRYNTAVRTAISDLLGEAYGAASVDFSARMSESVLTRLHYVVRMPAGVPIPDIDEQALEARIVNATRTWEEDFETAVTRELGEGQAARMVRGWKVGEAYKAAFDGRVAVGDVQRLESALGQPEHHAGGSTAVTAMPMNLYQPVGAPADERRVKIYRGQPLSLTAILPFFRNLGLEVTDERPYEFTSPSGDSAYIYDFGLRGQAFAQDVHGDRRALLTDALQAAWGGQTESDGMDELVLAGGLSWRQVVILRAYGRYLRQTSSTFSQAYIEQTLLSHPDVAAHLVKLFEIRFDPDVTGDRQDAQGEAVKSVLDALDDVPSLDADRILRSLLGMIVATQRTNFYQLNADGSSKPYVSFKLNPREVPDLPKPVPAREMWVYAPWVEGVHLRFGAVARGGLRWSDRREDFRTEILGLVKAQMVKNAVIVPTGAKGGFVAKQLPDPSDRDAWMAEGIRSYKTFISGLLDVTDNLVPDEDADGGRRVEPPTRVVRHDGDDTYLVVAADKGTATFSDIANGVSADYGFWLGDAFASGGSAGYDHKAMGITARGAWESVKRHFREMGVDTQEQPFTVVGVGDMSGDVFGNGMLLSRQIRLVAAFDHRHIFLDPDPDPATTYEERLRLFGLPRSSWADFDASLLSEGGGIHPLTAKSIPITPQVRETLGLDPGVDKLTPTELKRAVLAAPVDLYWNGGIGTYVKASTEDNTAVGDKANDAIRVDGRDLRVKVVGEGGNLGLTQLGRIEAALRGVRVNTDAVDNSAGVDCSDHEVNIKILLNRVVEDGDLTVKLRNELLEAMTGDVARLVLRDNYEQNVLLGNARYQSDSMVPVHTRLMDELETTGGLDREIEFLPTNAELEERLATTGQGLTSPEFSVLVAYSKIACAAEVLKTPLPDDPWFEQVLDRYFPQQVVERYPRRLSVHPLRREIITTWLVNDMVNRGGISFVLRAKEETGADADAVVRAYAICREVFGLADYVGLVEAMDNRIDTGEQTELYLEMRRLVDRAARWLIHNRPAPLNVASEIGRYGPALDTWRGRARDLLVGSELTRYEQEAARLVELGIDTDVADRAAGLLDEFSLLDVVDVATATGRPVDTVARLYYAISEHFSIDHLLGRVADLPRSNRWEELARSAVRDDLYAALRGLTRTVVASAPQEEDLDEAALIETWRERNAVSVERLLSSISAVSNLERSDLASMSVLLRLLRQVIQIADTDS